MKQKYKSLLHRNNIHDKIKSNTDILRNYDGAQLNTDVTEIKITKSKIIDFSKDRTRNESKMINTVSKLEKNFSKYSELNSQKVSARKSKDIQIHKKSINENIVGNKKKLSKNNSIIRSKIRVQSILNKQLISTDKEKLIIEDAIKREIIRREEFPETQDILNSELFEEMKQRKFIRQFLKFKDENLNVQIYEDNFYKIKENKINFKLDSNIVPSISNKIHSVKQSNHDTRDLLNSPNSIDIKKQKQLNVMRRQVQLLKDNLENMFEKQRKKTLIDIKIDDLYIKLYGKDKKLGNVDIYEYNDYLLFKYDRYKNVDIASQNIKGIIEQYYKN